MSHNNSITRYTAPRIATGTSSVLCLAALTLAIGAANTHAQTGSAGVRSLEEVIVTATRREESIQSIATSIQAVTGADLDNRGVHSFTQMAKLFPVSSCNSPKAPPAPAFTSAAWVPLAPVRQILQSG